MATITNEYGEKIMLLQSVVEDLFKDSYSFDRFELDDNDNTIMIEGFDEVHIRVAFDLLTLSTDINIKIRPKGEGEI
jgi:hypothetical protein